jgi:hypothetical protein
LSVPDDPGGQISFAGLKLANLSKPVITVLAVLIVLAAIGIVSFQQIVRPEFALITQQEANANLQASVNEYGRHIAEPPETSAVLMDDLRGRLTVQRYKDGCVVIARTADGILRSKLIVDLARDKERRPPQISLFAPFTVEAAGRCLNPHPGDFRTWYGQRNGCWIEVWRQWPDSCQHVQFFDSCHGTWDVNPNGTPRVRWTTCVH